jgi:nicotinamidase/pyrazinamidase
MHNPETSALIIVDLQVDFCPGGTLAVNGGDEIVSGINSLISDRAILFKKIILTADWHPKGHISFSSSHNLEPYTSVEIDGRNVTLWPDHCVEGSMGSGFNSDLQAEKADLIIRKGRNAGMDSYSAFYENDRKTPTGLEGYLENHGIRTVYLCGLALDWCVYFSALDSIQHSFDTYVIMDLTRAVDLPAGYAFEKEGEMKKAGINLIESSFFKELQNGKERG